jgi:hypothetical protein
LRALTPNGTLTNKRAKEMKENERGEEEENECPDLYGALNVENTATSIEVRNFLLLFFIRFCNRMRTSLLFSVSL